MHFNTKCYGMKTSSFHKDEAEIWIVVFSYFNMASLSQDPFWVMLYSLHTRLLSLITSDSL